LVSPNSSSALRNNSRKIRTETGKSGNLKKGDERWLRFSLIMEPVKNMKSNFVLHPMMNKNLSQFFKIHLHFPGILFGSRRVEQAKMGGFEFFGEGGFAEGKVVSRPPLRW
jgi:hypothetical protein